MSAGSIYFIDTIYFWKSLMSQISYVPLLAVQKRKHSPLPEPGGKRPPKGKGKRVPEEPSARFKEPEKFYCICRQPQNNRLVNICHNRLELIVSQITYKIIMTIILSIISQCSATQIVV